MTSPKTWSEHTKFTVTVGTLITVLVSVVSGTVWMTRAIDSLTESTKRIEDHIKTDWGLREEIVQYKNQKLLTPEYKLYNPKDSWRETHWMSTDNESGSQLAKGRDHE